MDPIIDFGEQAPVYQLPDLNGRQFLSTDFLDRIIVVVFWSAECEWCERVDRELMTYQERWNDKVMVVWIASNANETQDRIDRVASERKLSCVLLDTHQQVADLFGARTTPHFFIVDGAGKLAYQGAWNDITLRQKVATQVHVPRVVEALLVGQAPPVTQSPPYGCVLVRYRG